MRTPLEEICARVDVNLALHGVGRESASDLD